MIWKTLQHCDSVGSSHVGSCFPLAPSPSLYSLLPSSLPSLALWLPDCPVAMATGGGQLPCPHPTELAAVGVGCQQRLGLSWHPYPRSKLYWDLGGGSPGPRDPGRPPAFPLLPWLHCPSRLVTPSHSSFLSPPPSLPPSLSAQPRGLSDCQLRPPLAAPGQTEGDEAKPGPSPLVGTLPFCLIPTSLPQLPSPHPSTKSPPQCQKVGQGRGGGAEPHRGAAHIYPPPLPPPLGLPGGDAEDRKDRRDTGAVAAAAASSHPPAPAQQLDLPCVSRSLGQTEEMGRVHLFSKLGSLNRRLVRLASSPPHPAPL